MKNKVLTVLTANIFLMTLVSFNLSNGVKNVKAETNSRYNLCVFLRFHDEEDKINEIVRENQTRKDIVDTTYNADNYSMRDYYRGLSSNKVNLKTVYLFPNETGFDSFYLDGTRESYARQSSTNPNGYVNEATAGQLFKQDWASKIQQAFNKGILPCSISSRDETISYEDLDADKNGTIDSITLIFSPQEQTNFTSTRQEPLYPCMDTNSAITINTNGKVIKSNDYNQWIPNYESVIHEQNNDNYFLPFATGVHEMGHMFGYRDLYDYYQKTFPVGNMSVMSNLISPVPQYMTSYEREINGWINKENIQTIANSGDYTLSPVMSNNQTGIVTYKVPILDCPNKWLYFEYREFLDKNVNKYDAKDKNLYYANGNKVEVTSGKSGVLVYIVDKDSKYPTNSHGNAKYFGLEVQGGTTSSRNRSDAPRTQGDTLNIACYNSEGVAVSAGIYITIGEITSSAAKFNISYPKLDNLQQITREDIDNDKVYNKLSTYADAPFYNTTFDDFELINLAKLDIDNLEFLNLFDFKKLKYLVLFGNHISDLTGLETFITDHPNTIIVLDNNEIKLSELDSETLNLANVFYGLQNTQKNQKVLEYYVNKSFGYDYQICYQYEDENLKSLKNGEYGTFELRDNALVTIKSYYFFSNTSNMNFEYTINYITSVVVEPVSLTLNGDSVINLEYGEEFVDPGVTTNYQNDLSYQIEYNGEIVTSIHKIGTYTITYTVQHGDDIKTVSRTVVISDNTAPVVSLIGDENISALENEYQEMGVTYQDNSIDGIYDLNNPSDSLSLTIEYYLNGQKVDEITNQGTYTVKYIVRDASNNETILYRYVTITKKIEPITLSLIGESEVTIELGEIYVELGVNTNYPDSLQINITYQGEKVDEITNIGTYQITYTVTNGNDIKIVTRTIIVKDTTAPVVTLIGNENMTVLENEYQEKGVRYQDNSTNGIYDLSNPSETLSLVIEYYLDGQKVNKITTEGNYIVKYIVRDASNNETIVYRYVKVKKEVAPITLSLCGDSEIVLELGETFIDPGVNTNYSDILQVVITYQGEKVDTISSVGVYTITYTVKTDEETKYVTRTVIVKDTIAPTVSLNGDENYAGLEYEEFGVNYNDISGNCSLNIKYYNEDNEEVKNINKPGTYRVEYIVKDASGNVTMVTRNVTIKDPEAIVNNSDSQEEFEITKEYYSLDGQQLSEEPNEGEYQIKYTIKDKYGNTATYTEMKNIPHSGEDIPDIDTPKNNAPIITTFVTIVAAGLAVIVFGAYKIIKKRKN